MVRKESTPLSTSISLTNYERDVLLRICTTTSVTKAFRELIHMAQVLYAEGEYELKNMFEPNEWEYMANVLREENVDDFGRLSNSALLASIVCKPTYSLMAEYYKVDVKALSEKVREMLAMHVFALWIRIRIYWANPHEQTMEEFSHW